MSYMQEADAWLEQVLEPSVPGETEQVWKARTKESIKRKLLESYRNGQKAGPKRSKDASKEDGR